MRSMDRAGVLTDDSIFLDLGNASFRLDDVNAFGFWSFRVTATETEEGVLKEFTHLTVLAKSRRTK